MSARCATWLALAGGVIAFACAHPAHAGSVALTTDDASGADSTINVQLSSLGDAVVEPFSSASSASSGDSAIFDAASAAADQDLIRAASSNDPSMGGGSSVDLMDERLKLENQEPPVEAGDDTNRRTGGAPPLEDAGMPRVAVAPLPTPATLGAAGLAGLLLLRRRR